MHSTIYEMHLYTLATKVSADVSACSGTLHMNNSLKATEIKIKTCNDILRHFYWLCTDDFELG